MPKNGINSAVLLKAQKGFRSNELLYARAMGENDYRSQVFKVRIG